LLRFVQPIISSLICIQAHRILIVESNPAPLLAFDLLSGLIPEPDEVLGQCERFPIDDQEPPFDEEPSPLPPSSRSPLLLATMAATPKLTFFDLGGRGEPIRLAFFVSGIEFDDHRITHADWPTLKPSTPFGGLPMLELNGVTYSQSNSLLRYVGKLGGLYPTDAIDALKVDEILDFVEVRWRWRWRWLQRAAPTDIERMALGAWNDRT